MNKVIAFVVIRDFFLLIVGIWLFEFHLDFKLPSENNLLLFFVAIPIIWAALTQIWTSISYKEQKNLPMTWAAHILGILMLAGTIFLISAVLNTIEDNLDLTGTILFHGVGWTAMLAIIFYDIVDICR
jgi:hypothetical protein